MDSSESDQTPSGRPSRDQRRLSEYNAAKTEQTKDWNDDVEVVDKAKSAARNPREKMEKRKQRNFDRAKSWREGKRPQQQKPDFKARKETPEVVSPMYNVGPIIHGLTPVWHTKLP